jgi:hypothetical protein
VSDGYVGVHECKSDKNLEYKHKQRDKIWLMADDADNHGVDASDVNDCGDCAMARSCSSRSG